jgi:Fe2+ transport system protein FeoA
MKLSESLKGNYYRVEKITDAEIEIQATRFGIIEGEIITCFEKIPNGPTVIIKNNQEIAIGKDLADNIHVIEIK